MSDELKPCPFCGGEPYLQYFDGIYDYEPQEPTYCVECLECEAEGPTCGSGEEAIEAWNTRATGWIKTSERFPEMCKNVLVFSDEGEIYIGFMQLYSEWKIYEYSSQAWGISYEPEEFPYWMPLPEPPEVEE